MMFSMKRCNQLSIDVNGLFKAIQDECFILLNDVADKVVEAMRLYIVSDGAGRLQWRENAAAEFKVLSDKVASDIVEVQLGIRDNMADEAWHSFYAAQIMVALFGNHPGSGLTTKPGEITFHDHMESLYESQASYVWRLPDGFNWPDPEFNKILGNVMKMTQTYFKDGVNALLRNINFYDYVHVTAG